MFLTLCPYEVDHVIRERDMSIQKEWGREVEEGRGEKREGGKRREERRIPGG